MKSEIAVNKRNDGIAGNEFGVEENGAGMSRGIDYLFKKCLTCGEAYLIARLVYRRYAWIDDGDYLDVIEADDAQVFGNAQ